MKWHYGIFATAFMLSATCSNAQHGHDDGHLDYKNWSSKKTANCCNNEDCGYLASDEWRQNIQGDEVKIQNQWCPVKPEHYITKGKSPDWTKAHACIAKGGSYANVCDRLLCFGNAKLLSAAAHSKADAGFDVSSIKQHGRDLPLASQTQYARA